MSVHKYQSFYKVKVARKSLFFNYFNIPLQLQPSSYYSLKMYMHWNSLSVSTFSFSERLLCKSAIVKCCGLHPHSLLLPCCSPPLYSTSFEKSGLAKLHCPLTATSRALLLCSHLDWRPPRVPLTEEEVQSELAQRKPWFCVNFKLYSP